jgi:glycosyltransferase involved in cell wall biosynthesis
VDAARGELAGRTHVLKAKTMITKSTSSESPAPLLSLFVACYNEADNIRGTLGNVRDACAKTGISYEVIVIDDASRDDSATIIQAWMNENPEVPLQLIVNPRNLGLASNFITAARLASGEWYRLICGDNVEPMATLATVFQEIGKAEVLIPYHTQCPGKKWSRRFISTLYTLLVNLLSGHWVRYYNGLPVARRRYAEIFCHPALGFGFQADFVTQLLDRGLSRLEIPVKTHERLSGSSKALTISNIAGVCLVFRRILRRRVERLFGSKAELSACDGTVASNKSFRPF